MCGIVGYLGPSKAASVLVSELKCLEYRGYDSAGVAVIEGGRLKVLKAAGKLANLENLLKERAPEATVGIGHTRWATHGAPTDLNAHPHTDENGMVAVVHNGIIENFGELKDELIAKGYKFSSDTDTEVVAHLVSHYYGETKDMLKAVMKLVTRLKGIYALGIVNRDVANTIYAVNHHYSLTVGLGNHENFLASDSIAVRQYTNQTLRLDQSEIAVITPDTVKLYSFEGKESTRPPIVSESTRFVVDKGDYKHFLHKEIDEQPSVLRQTLAKYLPDINKPIAFHKPKSKGGNGNGHHVATHGIELTNSQIRELERVQVLACGTAYHAGMIGKYIIEELTGIPVDVEIASEIRGRKLLVNQRTLTVAVSQSGETADTLAAITEAKRIGSYVLGITNRPDSHLAQIVPNLIVTECGIEVSVAATKTYIAQLLSFYLLAIFLAEERGAIDAEKSRTLKKTLNLMPALQEAVLAQEPLIQEAAINYSSAVDMVFVGRGFNYPTALEGALKLKELSYIHASGYAAGELKHGPIAVLDEKVPVVAVVVPGVVYEKTLSNAQEAKARHAKMIAVAVEGDKEVEKLFDTVLRIPPIEEFFSPLLTVIPLQLFSYFVAEALGKDVDQPRNLAKSVTVE
ncbi:MAG: glutamine--fructose-6-phosphate transaminase (isomerizing) [Candidatus Melainabacteria bacterium]|nr:MAG: glutamine--fructose-6-phosphate transaminase (isomerizing) [Candidatus Melainabacteria bacterium]